MNDLQGKIKKSIIERKLILRDEEILVAVSGGVDSIVLLHLLHQLSQTCGWKLNVAHFNHQLRGRSSDADEKFVKKAAMNLKLKCIVGRGDVKAFSHRKKISVEMGARQLRHEFFAQTAARLKIKTIALAHHADDQVELFFLRLLRGSGPEGLGGMNWKSLSPANTSLQLLRPLLGQTKADLLEYAASQKIKFREDASNASKDFLRNRIRNEVIPLLKKIQPALDKTVLRTMEIAAWESNFVLGAALDWLSAVKKKPLSELAIAVQRVCLRSQLRTRGLPYDFDLIEKLRLQSDQLISINPKFYVYRTKLGLVGTKDATEISFNGTETRIDLAEQNETQFGQAKISWVFGGRKGNLIFPEENCEFFDAEKIGNRILLRHWKAGDRFQPLGMKSLIKLQDIFVNLKIPRKERHRRTIGQTESGEIFWVEGLRISERFKLDKQSRRRLKWRWKCLGAEVATETKPC